MRKLLLYESYKKFYLVANLIFVTEMAVAGIKWGHPLAKFFLVAFGLSTAGLLLMRWSSR